jgi:hypothetical protein
MATGRMLAYIVGGAFLCGVAGLVIVRFPLRDTLPSSLLVLIGSLPALRRASRP